MEKILNKGEEEILKQIKTITELTAVPGNEIKRAQYIQKLFFEYGSEPPIIDVQGNVIGKLSSKSSKDPLILFAHLDSHENTKKVKITHTQLIGDGLLSNAIGLYNLALMINALKDKEISRDIFFIGTTGGLTNYNGIKYFLKNFKKDIKSIINIKGSSLGEYHNATNASMEIKVEFEKDESYLKNNVVLGIANFINKIKEEEFNKDLYYHINNIRTDLEHINIPNTGSMTLRLEGKTLEMIKRSELILKNIKEGVSQEDNIEIYFTEKNIHGEVLATNNKLRDYYIEVLKGFKVNSKKILNSNEIEIPLQNEIDSISIGVANGGYTRDGEETLEIKSIYTGTKILYKYLDKLL
ncbi:MAG: M28 family peptidase [Fusobacteriota bacterium]